MSLVNILVTEDRALIGVDTDAGPAWSGNSRFNGQRARSKLLHLPHSNLVIAGRGFLDFLNGVFGYMVVMGYDFDSAAAAMLHMLGSVRLDIESLWAPDPLLQAKLTEIDTQFEGYLAGWSESANRMSVVHFEIALGEAEPSVETPRSKYFWVSPSAPFNGVEGQQLEVPTGYAAMLKIARAQTQWGRANRPDAAIGGRLVFATLSRHALTIESGEAL